MKAHLKALSVIVIFLTWFLSLTVAVQTSNPLIHAVGLVIFLAPFAVLVLVGLPLIYVSLVDIFR